MRRDYPGDENPSSCEIEVALSERLRTTTIADLPAAMDGGDQNDGRVRRAI